MVDDFKPFKGTYSTKWLEILYEIPYYNEMCFNDLQCTQSANLPACFVDCLGLCLACWFGFSFEVVSSDGIFTSFFVLFVLFLLLFLFLLFLLFLLLLFHFLLFQFSAPALASPRMRKSIKRPCVLLGFAGFCNVFDMFWQLQCAAQCRFCSCKDFSQTTFAKPLFHKHCFYTRPLLHKRCLYTSAVFTQTLLLHKACF